MFLHAVPYPHNDASPVILIVYMAAGAALGIGIAFGRELLEFGRRLRQSRSTHRGAKS